MQRKGFTLVEVLVGTGLIALVTIGVLSLSREATIMYMYDQGRIAVNRDIRKLTQQMTRDAVYANFFRVYSSFTSRSNNGSYNGTADAPLADGLSGDMLVLFSVEVNLSNGKQMITKIVAYYRDAPAPTVVNGATVSTPGPVRRREVTLSPSIDPTATTMISLLNTHIPVSSQSTNPTVIQLAQGLANGTLFYNFYNRSIIVRGQIQEQGSLYQKAVSTYNFTVSPRG